MTPDELKDWLQDKPREVAVAMAFRSAARVLPLAVGGKEAPQTLTFTTFRCLLISSVAALVLTDDINAAADAAADAFSAAAAARSAFSARSAAFSARSAAANANAAAADAAAFSASSAGRSAFAARSAAAAFSANANAAAAYAFSADFVVLANAQEGEDVPRDVLANPLWPQGDNPLQAVWARSRAQLEQRPGYTFWIDWYDGLLQGRAQNWDMLRDIALIEPNIWDEGAVAVAKAIATIQIAHLKPITVKAAPPSADRIAANPVRNSKAQRYSSLMQGVGDALTDVKKEREKVATNDGRDLADAIEKLDLVFDRDLDEPDSAHQGMYTAQGRLRRYLQEGILPEDADTPLNLRAAELDEALTRAMSGTRHLYVEVAELHAVTEKAPVTPVPQQQADTLREGSRVLGNAYGEIQSTSVDSELEAAIAPSPFVTDEERKVARVEWVAKNYERMEDALKKVQDGSVDTATHAAPWILVVGMIQAALALIGL